jgi:hypothetical protein
MELVDYASPFASSLKMLILMLFAGHAVADFGLQSEYMSIVKSRYREKPDHWFPVLWAHALIHGGVVAAITGSAILGMGEVALHFVIDDCKSANRFGYEADQALHYGCKVLWAAILLSFYQ